MSSGASPFTGEEILELDAYCRERFIELVPGDQAGILQHVQKSDTHGSLPDGV